MYRKIIVGYDEGEESEDALALGRELASLAESELLVANIFPVTRHTPGAATATLGGEAESRLAKVLDASSDDEAPRMGIRVLGETSAARGLQRLAELEGADLIVVGSHRSAEASTGMAGTVAERLLNGSPCAVAVAPRGHATTQPGLRVLAVAFHGSEESELALRTAASLALAAEATLRVIAVAQPAASEHAGAAPGTAAWDENPREVLRTELHEAVAGLNPALRPLPILETGDPAAVLADQAEAGVDLLVMGSRRYGPIRRVLLGSVSSVLLRRAPCPVLVVPRPHDVVEDRPDADASLRRARSPMAGISSDGRPAIRDVALLAGERAVEAASLLFLRPSRASVEELIAKGERDYATAVDVEIENTVRRVLSEAAPSIPVLGEEEGGASVHDDLFWALDPIDGTVNFSKGSPLCSISLALVESGRPTLGLLDVPLLREHYVAREGAGAALNGRRISVRRVERLEQAIVGMSDFAVGDLAAEENPIHLEIVRRLAGASLRTRAHGSASLDLAWLAAGRLDATAMLSNKLWDVSAGVLLVREAGGSVFDHDGSEYSVDSRFTIGATPPIAKELQVVIADAVAAAEPPVTR